MAIKPFETGIQPPEKRTWKRLGMLPLEEVLDVAKAQRMYRFHIGGQRSDGEIFKLPIVLDAKKASKQNGWDSCLAVLTLMQQAFAKLEGYLLCDCYPSKQIQCRQHSGKPN